MAAVQVPRWDVSDVFPHVGSREWNEARERLGADVVRLVALYDEHDVRGGAPAPVDEVVAATAETVLTATNDVLEQLRLLSAYLTAFVATDADDDAAQGELSSLQAEQARLAQLRTRLDAWVARYGAAALAAASPVAADHAYPLERAELRARYQMTEAEEALHAELSLTGGSAWRRLYGTFTAKLVVEVDLPAGRKALPVSRVRNLAHDPDPGVRRAAYEAELAGWAANAAPILAALNAIKGEAQVVNRRRGFADDLEPALVANGIDRATLDAMHAAVVASLPDFRRYLRAKARRLGHAGGLPWYDLFAPLEADPAVDWDRAAATVAEAFAGYSPRLGQLATRAVDERWIDAEARAGKRDGAFCMGLTADRSLVLMNFDGSFRDVQTLAHELGHAYHNVTLAERTPLQRQYPMTLAETASIFCETLLTEAGLAGASEDQRLGLLEGDLQAACQVVVDIHSRFLFERSFCAARATRTLSEAETCQLMLDAQEATYGDGLHPNLRHGYMWAAKPHYYGAAFYNWPYTFGLLFGLGLYARYREDPERFRDGYDDLLAACGLAAPADLAARFGIDVTDEGFWTQSLDVLRARIDEFEALATG